jgi:UDP-N-acetyl-2-amino-2-deoxyglucuronate dehydrogenase
VQTDGGSPFVSGVTQFVDPPINDIWTIPGEEHQLSSWQEQDEERCRSIDIMTHYHKLQVKDFLCSILEDREPAVNGQEGRKHVEMFTAIYRSQRDGRPVKFPLDALDGSLLGPNIVKRTPITAGKSLITNRWSGCFFL